jgi:hypothetical protein
MKVYLSLRKINDRLTCRESVKAFERGTMHARTHRLHDKKSWTNNPLFDKNLIGEITKYVPTTPSTTELNHLEVLAKKRSNSA